jgi:hypothetical protein
LSTIGIAFALELLVAQEIASSFLDPPDRLLGAPFRPVVVDTAARLFSVIHCYCSFGLAVWTAE